MPEPGEPSRSLVQQISVRTGMQRRTDDALVVLLLSTATLVVSLTLLLLTI